MASETTGVRDYPHAGRAMLISVAMVALVVLTPLLVGMVSPRMIGDLGMPVSLLGVGSTVFWVATALSAYFVAPLADRWGWPRAGAAGLGLTALVQVGLGFANGSFLTYCVWMALAGLGYGLVTPTSNLTVVRDVPPGRRGIAVGAKQAAAPLAGLIAGAVAPAIVLGLGWRWAFLVAAVVTAIAAVSTAATPTRGRVGPVAAPGVRAPRDYGILLVAVAGAFATVPIGVLSVYSALTLVEAGLRLPLAGGVVAGASIVALLTRLAGGLWIDRTGGDGMRSAAVLVTIGAAGMVAMSSGVTVLVVMGTVVAFSAGWGWPGLLLVGVLRHARGPAARASGRFQVGTAVGAAAGPVLFALGTAATGGLGVGWLIVGLLTLPAVPVILLAQRRFRRAAPDAETNEDIPEVPPSTL